MPDTKPVEVKNPPVEPVKEGDVLAETSTQEPVKPVNLEEEEKVEAAKIAEAQKAAEAVKPQIKTSEEQQKIMQERLETAQKVVAAEPAAPAAPKPEEIKEVTPAASTPEAVAPTAQPEAKPVVPEIKKEVQPVKELSWWDKLLGRKEEDIQPKNTQLHPATQELKDKLETNAPSHEVEDKMIASQEKTAPKE